MAGGRGRGGHGQGPTEEAPNRDRSVRDVTIEDLQAQVAELTRRLAAQEFGNREKEFSDSDSTFENLFPIHAQNREHRGREDWYKKFGFKIELPDFTGSLQTEGFIDWLNEIKRIFEYKEVFDRDKVKLVAIKFKGRASARWEQLKWSRERQGKAKITDWGKMKKKMKSHFLPFGYTQTLYQQLYSLKQGTQSVDDILRSSIT